jgi:hypothetical protein
MTAISFLTTALATFFGAVVAFGFALWKSAYDRRADFRRQQLSEFYSPLAGQACRIRALLGMSQRVREAAAKGWVDALAPYGASVPERIESDSQRFSRVWDYENNQLDEDLLPAYRRILDLFTEKYWLALPATRHFYESYYAFVEHWNRVKKDSLPVEVRLHVPQHVSQLTEFFDHLEATLQHLQDRQNRMW